MERVGENNVSKAKNPGIIRSFGSCSGSDWALPLFYGKYTKLQRSFCQWGEAGVPAMTTVYMKAELSCIVSNKTVLLGDVCQLYSRDDALLKDLKRLELFHIEKTEKQKIAVSVMYVIRKIADRHPDVVIINEGEDDFVIEYLPPIPQKKWVAQCKAALVSLIVFFGSAFTIMTFNEDANVEEIFSRIYVRLAGMPEGNGWLEAAYCVGLPLGILLFFNHFSSAKLSSDPTPLQIQMRQYEQQEDSTIIENESRKGKRLE